MGCLVHRSRGAVVIARLRGAPARRRRARRARRAPTSLAGAARAPRAAARTRALCAARAPVPSRPGLCAPDAPPPLLGAQGTLEYRVHFSYDGQTISPWHDIPLSATGGGLDGALHFCCEIPKWTRRKFEVATKEAENPIKQDEKKGVLREYKWGGAWRRARSWAACSGCFAATVQATAQRG
jgi:hypothetical protein